MNLDSIALEDARRIIAAGEAKATEIGQPSNIAGDICQPIQINVGGGAHSLEHVDKVLGSDVASRTGRERAAAEPGD